MIHHRSRLRRLIREWSRDSCLIIGILVSADGTIYDSIVAGPPTDRVSLVYIYHIISKAVIWQKIKRP
jgi:hypothetical protein